MFPKDHWGSPVIESPVEGPPGDRFVPGGSLQGLQVLGAEDRIGVVKAQERSTCLGSSEVHLLPARRFVARNQADDTLAMQLAKAFSRPYRSHNPFGKVRRKWPHFHQINDQFVIIPSGNN